MVTDCRLTFWVVWPCAGGEEEEGVILAVALQRWAVQGVVHAAGSVRRARVEVAWEGSVAGQWSGLAGVERHKTAVWTDLCAGSHSRMYVAPLSCARDASGCECVVV